MKILNLLLAAVFLLFAIVQYNDPDPWLWVALYGFVAGVAAFAAFGKYHSWLVAIGLALSIVWLASLTPGLLEWIQMGMPNIASAMKAETPYIENTREFLGVFLCVLVLFFQYIQARKKSGALGV